MASEVWHRSTQKKLFDLEGHSDTVSALVFSDNGQMLVSASHDQTLKLWDMTTRDTLATLKGHRGAVQAVACSPDAQVIASGGADNSVRVWQQV